MNLGSDIATSGGWGLVLRVGAARVILDAGLRVVGAASAHSDSIARRVPFWRWRPAARRSAFGLLTGAGVLLMYVAWLQRDGPGTTCRQIAPAGIQCDQHLNPLPWLLIGIVLVLAGFVTHARRG